VDPVATSELEALARRALAAAEGFDADDAQGMGGEYEALRGGIEALNTLHLWARPEDFATMFPTLQAQDLIESLDNQFGRSSLNFQVAPGPSVERLLSNLGHWATGVALASRAARDFDI
jgi:hypothetical protein